MQELPPLLNRAAETWIPLVFHVTWQASLLAAVLLAVVLIGCRWSSPLRYGLLVLALVKFALPPLVSLPTGLFSHVVPAVEIVTPEAIALAPINADSDPKTVPNLSWWGVPMDSSAQAPSKVRPQPMAPLPPATPALHGYAWLLILYFFGVFASMFWIGRGLLGISRVLRSASAITEGEIHDRFVHLSSQLGLLSSPRLVLASGTCGPAAYGLLRPVVILPASMVSLPPSELDVILAHELAHHRRRDLWINAVQLALAAAWWFNPVLWILNRQIRKVREDCCDDLLLAQNLTTGQAYCETLLSAATKLTELPRASVALGFGDRLHPLGRRFERIMDRTLRRAPRLSLTGILILFLVAGLMLPGLRRSEGKEPANEPAAHAQTKPHQGGADVVPAPNDWPEGTTVTGRVVNQRGQPVANAEVLLLGKERIIVDGETRTWFVPGMKGDTAPSSRSDKTGAFRITRTKGAADRIGIISDELLFWVVSRDQVPGDIIEIKLPETGGLAVHCDLPGKPAKQPVNIEWHRNSERDSDWLRFHFGSCDVPNPGNREFKRLPPGRYSVQCYHEFKNKDGSLLSGADVRIADVKANNTAVVRFEKKGGRIVTGRVRGVENVELRDARVAVRGLGPDEGTPEKPFRQYLDVDIVPVSADGGFTIKSVPPGKYYLEFWALRATTPRLSSQSPDFTGRIPVTVSEKGDVPNFEIFAKASEPQDLSKVNDVRLRVTDEGGKAISKFQAMYHTAERGYGRWTNGHSGLVFPGLSPNDRGPVDILVRADGYAPIIAHFAVDDWAKLQSGEATVDMRRGQKVELRFKLPQGMTWPKGTLPEAYFDAMQERVRMMRQPSNRRGDTSDFNMLNLREVGPGRFELNLAKDTRRFHVAVHAPGFLQHFESGAFSLADVKQGVLDIEVPRPATLDVSFSPGEHAAVEGPFKSASLHVMWQLQGNSYLSVASSADDSLTPNVKLTDLAPGSYFVEVRTQPKIGTAAPRGDKINEGAYYDRMKLTVKSGQTEKIAFRSTPFDPDAFRGKRTAIVRIRTPDGKPAKDRKASIQYFDGHYGMQDVFSGPVPESGEIVLSGITDKAQSWYPRGPYQVRIDNKHLGFFSFTEETGAQKFEFVLAPVAGDMAPDVELTRLKDSKTVHLSSFRGKLVFLEFWATWCGPCQVPMSKLNALGDEKIAAWKDRVAFVPVSIDAEQARVKTHVEKRDWTRLDHFWSGGGADDFDAPAARAFVVSGVPEAILIGTDGRILWRGHPLEKLSGKDLKSRIEDALK